MIVSIIVIVRKESICVHFAQPQSPCFGSVATPALTNKKSRNWHPPIYSERPDGSHFVSPRTPIQLNFGFPNSTPKAMEMFPFFSRTIFFNPISLETFDFFQPLDQGPNGLLSISFLCWSGSALIACKTIHRLLLAIWIHLVLLIGQCIHTCTTYCHNAWNEANSSSMARWHLKTPRTSVKRILRKGISSCKLTATCGACWATHIVV